MTLSGRSIQKLFSKDGIRVAIGKKGSVIFGKRGERVKDEKKRGDG
jgi:hypothetical protein